MQPNKKNDAYLHINFSLCLFTAILPHILKPQIIYNGGFYNLNCLLKVMINLRISKIEMLLPEVWIIINTEFLFT